MLASFGSGSPFWSSFKKNPPAQNNTTVEPAPKRNTAADSHDLADSSLTSTSGSSFNPMLLPDTPYEDLFPSSMELLVLDELISQLRTKIAEESANNARSSNLNRSSSMRGRPRPLSGLGIGGLAATGAGTPKRHSRSLSRSSVVSIDSITSVENNKCTELYPYCEVVGEHIIKLAENATHWSWAMNCFNNLSQIYSTLDSLFIDKSPSLYTMTIMSILACHMCKALQTRGGSVGPRRSSTASEASKKEDVRRESSASNTPTLPKKTHKRAKSSISAPSIINKAPIFSEAEEDPARASVSTDADEESEEHASGEQSRKLSKKEIEQLNNDLCEHVLSAFSMLVTSQSHSSTLNLVLGQTITYVLANIHLTPKFVKAFFEKLRSSQRLFWYPRSQILRQWRLYWLRVVMDRMVVYTDFHAEESGRPDAKHNYTSKDGHINSNPSSAVHSNRASNSHLTSGHHGRNLSISSINFNLENLNIYGNGGNQAGNTNSVISTATNDSESTGTTAASSASPALSTTSTMISSNNESPTLVSGGMSDCGYNDDTDKTVAEAETYISNPYLLPVNHNDIPHLANLKKITANCIDELFVGVSDESDAVLKQHTEAVFSVHGQR